MTAISQAEMEVYKETAQKRVAKRYAEIGVRFERAWRTARRASDILKKHYGEELTQDMARFSGLLIDVGSVTGLAQHAVNSMAETWELSTTIQEIQPTEE